MSNVIAVILIVVFSLGFSWGITVGLIKLITMCFGWQFSLPIATGIWLVTLLLKPIFTSNSK